MAELSVQIKLKAFDEVSSRFANIIEAGSRLSAQFDENRERLQSLNEQTRKMQAFDTLRQKVANTGQSLNEACERVQRLHQELQRGSAGRSARQMNELRQQYERARRTADSLQRTHARQQERLAGLNSELREAGINTQQMASEQDRLNASSQALIGTMERQAERLRARTDLGENLNNAREAYNGRMERADAVGEMGQKLSMAGAVVVGAVGMGVKGLIDTASQFEKFEAILTTTEGSSQNARKALGWVSEFAAKTPYELAEITDAFVQMRAYGLDPTNGLLATLGDTASAMGKDLRQAVEAIADAVTGENERLKEFGIKGSKNQKTGNFEYAYTDKNGVEQIKTANAEDRAEIEKVLKEIWGEKYTGGMENLSKTFEGQMGKLKDIWVQFKLAIMQHGLFDAMKERLGEAASAIEKLQETGEFDAWAKKIGTGLKVIFDGLWQLAQTFVKIIAKVGEFAQQHPVLTQFITKFFGIALAATVVLGPMLIVTSVLMKFGSTLIMVGQMIGAWAGYAKTMFGIVSTAIRAMGMGLLTNPIVLIITGIAVAGLLIYKYWQPLKAFLSGFWQGFLQGFAPTLSVLKNAFVALQPVFKAIVQGIGWLVNAFMTLTTPAQTTKVQLDGVGNAGQRLGQLFGQMMVIATGAFTTIGTALGILVGVIQMHGGQVLSFFFSLPSKILGFLVGLPAQMQATGGNIMDGLKNGIIDGAKRVIDNIMGVASNIKSTFTSAFDIHSPSRVFASYGGYMMAGLDQGIAGGADNVVKSTAGVTAKIRAGLNNVSANTLNAGLSLGGGASAGAVANAPANIVININGATDPQAVARAVQSELARVQASQMARERRRMMD